MPYTASQIVADACAMAKCPGYIQQGGRMLNLVLQDLVLHRNLKVNLTTTTINFVPNSFGPFNLETNYARTYDMFYTVSGTPYFLNPCTLKQIDGENYQSGIESYPYEYATDLSEVPTLGNGLLYIYPATPTPYVVTHRYFMRQADITTPETSSTIPWFEDQNYLITATAARMMMVTDDDRFTTFEARAEKLLEIHLIMEGDEQNIVKEVQLDPRRFRQGGSSRPTKLDPY